MDTLGRTDSIYVDVRSLTAAVFEWFVFMDRGPQARLAAGLVCWLAGWLAGLPFDVQRPTNGWTSATLGRPLA